MRRGAIRFLLGLLGGALIGALAVWLFLIRPTSVELDAYVAGLPASEDMRGPAFASAIADFTGALITAMCAVVGGVVGLLLGLAGGQRHPRPDRRLEIADCDTKQNDTGQSGGVPPTSAPER
jgi:hypothetical protein